jgi:predicted ribonuclease YlaK
LKALGDKKRSYDGIILCRPFIPIDNESIGYLPGTLEEKADPYMMAY